jgi:hypothetical protein
MEGRWGFADKGVSQGTALTDLDLDGDLDVIVNRLNDACGVYRNDASAPRLAVRLRGPPGNGQASAPRSQSKEGQCARARRSSPVAITCPAPIRCGSSPPGRVTTGCASK